MDITTKITDVVVYSQGARVTRTGSVTLEAGIHTLEVSDLPLKLQVDSLRVNARGVAGARLMSTDVQHIFFSTTPAEHLRHLETQIEATQDALNELQARKQWLQIERDSLAATLKAGDRFAAALALGKLDPDAHFQTLQHFRTHAQELSAALISAEAEERTLKRRLTQLTEEYRQYAESRPREQYRAWVTVDLPQPGTLTLALSYTVPDASWTPFYDLRLTAAEHLEVTYLSQVEQRTGEAWDDVTLTLSTARPVSDLSLPELKPWPLDERKPPRMPMLMRAAGPAGEEALATPMTETSLEEVQAHVVENLTAITYRLPVSVTVPPDGTVRKVTVARFELKPELAYLSIPKLDLSVYRRAHIINHSPYTWLPGTASLFWDDSFVGRTQLALLPPE